MRRPIIDPRVLGRLQSQFFTRRATIEERTAVQDSTGEEIVTYVVTVSAIPCVIRAARGAEIGGEYLVAAEQYDILLQGQYDALTQSSRLVIDGQAYDVQSIERDPFGAMTRVGARIVR